MGGALRVAWIARAGSQPRVRFLMDCCCLVLDNGRSWILFASCRALGLATCRARFTEEMDCSVCTFALRQSAPSVEGGKAIGRVYGETGRPIAIQICVKSHPAQPLPLQPLAPAPDGCSPCPLPAAGRRCVAGRAAATNNHSDGCSYHLPRPSSPYHSRCALADSLH